MLVIISSILGYLAVKGLEFKDKCSHIPIRIKMAAFGKLYFLSHLCSFSYV